VRRRLRTASQLAELRQRIDEIEVRLQRRIEQLETQLHESREESWERSRVRWRTSKPSEDLTWGVRVSGDAFVDKARDYGAFGAEKVILEVGPGYGRLLSACIERGVEFARYIGVDLSSDNIAHLRERFPRNDVRFVQADVETVTIDQPVDAVLSSLTFKHFFPSFQPALQNLRPQLAPGGVLVFDLIEGERRYFEDDQVTYIRWYTKPEIEEILGAAGLDLVVFDEVRHLPELVRLLVVARNPA
jgi:SAM-dependent methyltransferase